MAAQRLEPEYTAAARHPPLCWRGDTRREPGHPKDVPSSRGTRPWRLQRPSSLLGCFQEFCNNTLPFPSLLSDSSPTGQAPRKLWVCLCTDRDPFLYGRRLKTCHFLLGCWISSCFAISLLKNALNQLN